MVLVGRDPRGLEEVAEVVREEGREVLVVVEDLGLEGAVGRVVARVGHLELGVIVNNVGVMGEHFMPFLDMGEEEVERMVRVNTTTAAQVPRRACPLDTFHSNIKARLPHCFLSTLFQLFFCTL